MKRMLLISIMALLAFTINTSCDKLDITEEFEIEITFQANSSTADYTDMVLFDATESSDVIADYANKIEKIEIQRVTVKLLTFNGEPGQEIVTNSLVVADENGDGEALIATVTNQPLEPLLTTPLEVTIDQAGIDRFSELIKNSPHKARVTNSGSADSTPIDFTCVFTFEVRMTANPL